MAAAQKFLFDTTFDVEATAVPAPVPAKIEPVMPVAEAEAAREAAFAEGRASAIAEAAMAVESRLAAAIERMGLGVERLIADQGEIVQRVEKHAVELVQEVVRKLAPNLARRTTLDETMELLRECLREAMEEPRIVLRVSDQFFEDVKARLAPLTEAAGYAGKVVLLADETLGETDCRIEWADGGAERDFARTWTDVEAAMARALTAFRSD